jgi:hypothetical protein
MISRSRGAETLRTVWFGGPEAPKPYAGRGRLRQAEAGRGQPRPPEKSITFLCKIYYQKIKFSVLVRYPSSWVFLQVINGAGY